MKTNMEIYISRKLEDLIGIFVPKWNTQVENTFTTHNLEKSMKHSYTAVGGSQLRNFRVPINEFTVWRDLGLVGVGIFNLHNIYRFKDTFRATSILLIATYLFKYVRFIFNLQFLMTCWALYA